MFRASIAPIIRSTQNCSCSLWYRSYYLGSKLLQTWPNYLVTFEEACSTDSIICTTRGCNKSFMYSWWWARWTLETCTIIYQYINICILWHLVGFLQHRITTHRTTNIYKKTTVYLPEDLIGAHDDRLLTVLHIVLDLQYTMNPQPVARSPLKTQQQDARSVLFRLSDWKNKNILCSVHSEQRAVPILATAQFCHNLSGLGYGLFL